MNLLNHRLCLCIHQLNLHETKSTKIDFLPVTGSPVHQIPCPQSKKKLCHPSVITEASRLKTATSKQYQHDVQMDLQNETQSQQHSITLQSSAGCQGVHIKARHSTMNKRTLLLSSVTSCGSFNPPWPHSTWKWSSSMWNSLPVQNSQEELYLEQTEGFVLAGREKEVCRPNKCPYKFKQAPRVRNQKLNEYL
jgi:hypothetical protein